MKDNELSQTIETVTAPLQNVEPTSVGHGMLFILWCITLAVIYHVLNGIAEARKAVRKAKDAEDGEEETFSDSRRKSRTLARNHAEKDAEDGEEEAFSDSRSTSRALARNHADERASVMVDQEMQRRERLKARTTPTVDPTQESIEDALADAQ